MKVREISNLKEIQITYEPECPECNYRPLKPTRKKRIAPKPRKTNNPQRNPTTQTPPQNQMIQDNNPHPTP